MYRMNFKFIYLGLIWTLCDTHNANITLNIEAIQTPIVNTYITISLLDKLSHEE